MKFDFLACRRFHALVNLERERDLSEREQVFLAHHRAECDSCQDWEASLSGSLAFLHANSLEPIQLDDDFTFRVARKSRIVQQRDSVRYWVPAFLGAGVACLVLLAALQLASHGNAANPSMTVAQRNAQRGFQASVTPYTGIDASDQADAARKLTQSTDGPLLLVLPKAKPNHVFEP